MLRLSGQLEAERVFERGDDPGRTGFEQPQISGHTIFGCLGSQEIFEQPGWCVVVSRELMDGSGDGADILNGGDGNDVVLTHISEFNTAPTLATIGNQTVDEGVSLTFTAVGSDVDVPPQPLTYSLDAGAPALFDDMRELPALVRR